MRNSNGRKIRYQAYWKDVQFHYSFHYIGKRRSKFHHIYAYRVWLWYHGEQKRVDGFVVVWSTSFGNLLNEFGRIISEVWQHLKYQSCCFFSKKFRSDGRVAFVYLAAWYFHQVLEEKGQNAVVVFSVDVIRTQVERNRFYCFNIGWDISRVLLYRQYVIGSDLPAQCKKKIFYFLARSMVPNISTFTRALNLPPKFRINLPWNLHLSRPF